MFTCVISDLGKVILRFDNHIFFQKIAQYCPYSAREIAERVHRHSDLIKIFDSGKIESQEFYREAIQRLEADVDQKTFFRIYTDIFSLDRSVLNILKRLKDRYFMVLLSNTDIERFGFVRRKFPEILIFNEYVLSYEVGLLKPHPGIYRTALARAQARPEESIFVDDLKENIDGAAKVGIHTILFEPHTDLEGELKRMGVSF